MFERRILLTVFCATLAFCFLCFHEYPSNGIQDKFAFPPMNDEASGNEKGLGTDLEITIPVDQKESIVESCKRDFLYHPLSEIMFDGLHMNEAKREEFRKSLPNYMKFSTESIVFVPELSSSLSDTWNVILRVEVKDFKFYVQCMQSMYKRDGNIKSMVFVALDSYYPVKYGLQFFRRFAKNFIDTLTMFMHENLKEGK